MIARNLAIIWSLVAAALFVAEYVVPSDINSVLAALIPMLGALGVGYWLHEKRDPRFTLLSSNTIVILSFASLLLPVYALVKGLIPTDMAIAIYVLFTILAVTLADVEDVPVIENESSSARGFAYGIGVGALTSIVAYLIYNSFGGAASLLVGYLPLQLYEYFGSYLALFMLMLFVVAIPEELFFRIYLYKVGRFAVTTVPAALVSGAAWFALHAVTRAPDYMALVVLGIVGAVLYAVYGLYGFIGSVAAHAMYNVGIVMIYDLGFEYAAIALVLIAVAAIAVGYKVKAS